MTEPDLPVILPDNILRSQVCQECFQYLSVGPITMNDRGESICGRCHKDQTVPRTVSLHGLLAQGFKFKCTNHINGCNEVLFPSEMKNHERNCFHKAQDCFYCSFTGNLSQIVNHSSQCHPKKITFDGQFMISLSDIGLKKTLMYLFNDKLYLITIQLTEEVVKIQIQLQNRKVTEANHLAIKFVESENPSDSMFIVTDYGLLHDKSPTYFEKSLEHLITSFGPKATLCCQILVDDFKMLDKDVEIQKCYAMLRISDEKLAQLQSKVDSYNVARKIIKIMSHTFFKCMNCMERCTVDVYFCENVHVYCERCLEDICKICNLTMQFQNLKELENFEVPCDDPDCDEIVKISQYFDHKVNCSKRTYKCPLKSCNKVVLSAEGLIQHWHSEIPKLCLDKIIHIESYEIQEYYWLIKSDLYRVHVSFSVEDISVLIDEIDVLNTDKIIFKCDGYDGYEDCWFQIPISLLCGKSYFTKKNSDTSELRITVP